MEETDPTLIIVNCNACFISLNMLILRMKGFVLQKMPC